MRIIKKIFLILIILSLLGIFSWLLFGYFKIQTLWVDNVVDEEVPVVISDEAVSSDIDDNEIIENQLQLLANSEFQQGESTYTISGKIQLTTQDQISTLSLIDFEVSNGPDLFVYLVNSQDSTKDSVNEGIASGSYISLSELKGNIGNQNYNISEINFAEYNTVVIWCEEFSRNFGYAKYEL